MIFGLGFATFLTLILVPIMYLLLDSAKLRLKKLTAGKENGKGSLLDVALTQPISNT